MPNPFLQNYFGFNKQQRNGLYVLVLISFLLLVIRIAYPYFIERDDITILNLPLVERHLDSAVENSQKKQKYRDLTAGARKSRFFDFDPNTVTAEQLELLGFSEKQSRAFINYRSKGVVFKRKEDLKKVYVVSDFLYARLESHIKIKIPESASVNEQTVRIINEAKKVKFPLLKLELNSADSIALVALPGIGPVFAKRIIKYRSMLRGYVLEEQLMEVYGFTEETYEKTHSYFSINTSLVKKINPNTDDFKTITRHPYLGYEVAKLICNRRRNETITPQIMEELLNDPSRYSKVLPYLSFE